MCDEKRNNLGGGELFCRLASNKIAKVMMVSFGKFNRERMKILEGKEWENPLEEGKDESEGDKAATQPNASN